MCITIVLLSSIDAWAADNAGFSRADWDLIMRWVNFIILAVLIIKYARKPLADFLNNKKNEVARLLERYENQKKEAEIKIHEGRQMLTESEQRLKVVKERIISEGERRREKAIEAAREESRIMLETAQLKIEGQLREAHSKLKAEIIDLAAQKAMAKISTVLTVEDHDRLVDQWMEAAR
jgi:F-type H+-transporting ATPase subunit b